MKRKTIYLLCISLLTGCTTPQYQEIAKQEKAAASSNVVFRVNSPEFQVALNSNNRIVSVCNMSHYCAPVDTDNEVIQISKDSIGLGGHYYRDVRCGVGLVTVGGVDKYNNDKNTCNSRFYTSDWFIPWRVAGGLLTFGFFPLFNWSLHKDSFDDNAFSDAVYNARIHDLQTLLYSADSDKRKDSISVVRVDASDIDDAYKAILNKPIDSDSVIFIDDDTQKPLYYLRLKDYADKELPVAVNQQLSDFFHSLASRVAYSPDTARMDVKRMIPPEIALPALPPIPQLTKSEYETKDEFNERVNQAVSDREEAIRKLQRQYISDVNNRNQYIVALGESWQQYLDGKSTEKNELVRKLKKQQTGLARLLYVMNMGKFTASDMSYDSESKALYFTATSSRYGFQQKMLAKVPPSLAQSIKVSSKYKLTPDLAEQDGAIRMKGLLLTETNSGDKFETHYTDINFKPEQVSVRVATGNLKINKEQSAIFKSYEQKPQAVVDANVKEVWYIDTVTRINAKMPEWYSTPEQSNKVRGYGAGNSPEEAMLNARKELASMVKTTITSTTDILQKNNTFKSLQEVTQHTQASSDIELNAGDVAVLRQAEMDGKYYVALCYRCNMN